MTAIPAWTQLLLAVGGLLTVVTALARLLLRHFPPRSVSLAAEVAAAKQELSEARASFNADLATVKQEVATVRADAAAEAAGFRAEVSSCRAEMRLLTDYAHDLREHIALEKDPPPPDWPVGLRL